jgi:hypothetical protein
MMHKAKSAKFIGIGHYSNRLCPLSVLDKIKLTEVAYAVDQCTEYNKTKNGAKQAVDVDIIHVLKKSSLFKVVAVCEQHWR